MSVKNSAIITALFLVLLAPGSSSGETNIPKLKAEFRSLMQVNNFQPGQLVRWKPGLKNKNMPLLGDPAIVMAVLDRPVLGGTDDSGSSYFREPLDLLLGMTDKDGDFVIYHFDKRRFEPFPDSSAKGPSDAKHEELIGRCRAGDNLACGEYMRKYGPLGKAEPGKKGESVRGAWLRSLWQLYRLTYRFQPAQLVRWKTGMKNKNIPEYGEPGLVVSVLDTPVLDATKEDGSPYFREPLDLLLGMIDPKDGQLVIYHLDQHRFEPYLEQANGPGMPADGTTISMHQ